MMRTNVGSQAGVETSSSSDRDENRIEPGDPTLTRLDPIPVRPIAAIAAPGIIPMGTRLESATNDVTIVDEIDERGEMVVYVQRGPFFMAATSRRVPVTPDEATNTIEFAGNDPDTAPTQSR